MNKYATQSKYISSLCTAYDKNADLGFFAQQIYAFSSNSNYFPDPYMGFRLIAQKSKYLSILEDGSRSLGSTSISNLYDNKKGLLLCYGGSVMFGSYSASDAKTIPGYLGKSENLSKNYEIKNLALPGAIIVQNFSHFFNYVYPKLAYGRKFRIVFLFGFNEFQSMVINNSIYNSPIVGPLQSLLGKSRIVKLIKSKSRIKDINSARIATSTKIEIDSLINHAEAFARLISLIGGEAFFYFQPILSRSKKKRIEIENKFGKLDIENLDYFVSNFRNKNSNYIKFRDLSDIFDSVDDQIFIDEVHMGCKGNRLISQCIVKDLDSV